MHRSEIYEIAVGRSAGAQRATHYRYTYLRSYGQRNAMRHAPILYASSGVCLELIIHFFLTISIFPTSLIHPFCLSTSFTRPRQGCHYPALLLRIGGMNSPLTLHMENPLIRYSRTRHLLPRTTPHIRGGIRYRGKGEVWA